LTKKQLSGTTRSEIFRRHISGSENGRWWFFITINKKTMIAETSVDTLDKTLLDDFMVMDEDEDTEEEGESEDEDGDDE